MKTIISASRRTDIPAFYLEWLIEGIERGWVEVENPVTKNRYKFSLKKEDVHTIVLWSKNFSEFLKLRHKFSKYHLYFHFTINNCPELEPNIPPLEKRILQLRELVKLYGPERVAWRFDPIVFWAGGAKNNMGSFERILKDVSRCGIKLCVFSFATWYRKALRRMKKASLNVFDHPLDKKLEIAARLKERAILREITMRACCNPALKSVVEPARCIDGRLLSNLANEPATLQKDSGQRKECNCTQSRDIGSYSSMQCLNRCLYCYANPAV